MLKHLWKDESGQGMAEYALIVAIVAIGLILILFTFRDAIGDVFNNAAQELQAAPGDSYGAGG